MTSFIRPVINITFVFPAAEQPYRRYSYHGSVRKDAEPRSPDAGERPVRAFELR